MRPPLTRPLPPTPEATAEDREDAERFAACLAWVRGAVKDPVAGVFGPGSVHWAIAREPGSLLGTGAAVLLHLAHPAVAAGVSVYSDWERDFVGRARRTFTSMYQFMLGDLDEACGAAERLYGVHRRVRGVVEEPGNHWTGRPYRANDQALLRWVGLSVAVVLRQSFTRFVRPFTVVEAARDEEEMLLSAALSGVLPDARYRGRADVDRYFAEMLVSDELVVGPTARRIARALFNSPYTRGNIDEILCAGMLPERFRVAYELPWGRKEQAIFEAISRASRAARRCAPEPIHGVVAWHQATLRVARAEGRRGPVWGRALNAVDGRFDLPTSLRPIAAVAGQG